MDTDYWKPILEWSYSRALEHGLVSQRDIDLITVTDSTVGVLLVFDIEPLSNNPNESYTRNPDLTGEFEQHNDNTSFLFSPGTKVDGSPFVETSTSITKNLLLL